MIQTILGAKIRWIQPNGWIFDPVIIGPDTIDYTLAAGPHTGRHAVHKTYFHRIAPGIEATSWYEETGTVVHIIWYLQTQTTHRVAALPRWAQEDMQALIGDNRDPEYLERIRHLTETKPDGPRWILADDGYFETLDADAA
jgi:phenolic acid decarboxylase